MRRNKGSNLTHEMINPFLADSYATPLHTYYQQIEARKGKFGATDRTPEEEKAIAKQLEGNAKYGGCV